MMTAYDLTRVSNAVQAIQKAVSDQESTSLKLVNLSLDVMINKKKVGRIITKDGVVGFEPSGDFDIYVQPDKTVGE